MKTLYHKFIFCVLVVFVFPFTPLNSIYKNLKEFFRSTYWDIKYDFRTVKQEWDRHFKNKEINMDSSKEVE